MHFAAVLTLISAFSAGTSAGTIRRQDRHIVDFRTYGKAGCKEDNQGIWTFTESQLAGCKSFASFGDDSVQSLNLVDIAEGCSLTVFTDEGCNDNPVQPSPGQCQDGALKSFLLAC